MKNSINKSLEQAIIFWYDNSLDVMDYVLLIPDDCNEFSQSVIKVFIAKLGDRSGKIIKGRQTQLLIDMYSLYAFTDKIIIGSFNEPNGRKLHNLINSGIATEEELINDVIFGGM